MTKKLRLILSGILITFCPSMKMFSFLEMQTTAFRGEMFKYLLFTSIQKQFKKLKGTTINFMKKNRTGMR